MFLRVLDHCKTDKLLKDPKKQTFLQTIISDKSLQPPSPPRQMLKTDFDKKFGCTADPPTSDNVQRLVFAKLKLQLQV